VKHVPHTHILKYLVPGLAGEDLSVSQLD